VSGQSHEEFTRFVAECRHAVGHQVAGNTEPFQALWSHADDVVLMGALGSYAVGWPDVSTSLSFASSHLNWSGWNATNLLTSVTEVLAFTLDLEHMTRVVDGETQERTLRASQGYRLEDGQWRVIFRHGDPMAERIQPPPLPAR